MCSWRLDPLTKFTSLEKIAVYKTSRLTVLPPKLLPIIPVPETSTETGLKLTTKSETRGGDIQKGPLSREIPQFQKVSSPVTRITRRSVDQPFRPWFETGQPAFRFPLAPPFFGPIPDRGDMVMGMQKVNKCGQPKPCFLPFLTCRSISASLSTRDLYTTGEKTSRKQGGNGSGLLRTEQAHQMQPDTHLKH